MAFEYSKLRGRIVEKFGTQTAFAEALGNDKNTVSRKLNNDSQFTKEDIERWSDLLDIERCDVGIYFFA